MQNCNIQLLPQFFKNFLYGESLEVSRELLQGLRGIDAPDLVCFRRFVDHRH